MKTAAVILASFNTLPLGVWVFIVLPLVRIIQQDIAFEGSALSQFCGYGFLWGALLFPVILLFNHFFFLRNYIRQAFRPALNNQLITLAYLLLTLTYGLIARS